MTGTCFTGRAGMARLDSLLLRSIAPVALLGLAACGGGSSGGINPTPTPPSRPTPTPTPTPVPTPAPSGAVPTPAPVPSGYNTLEFRQSDGPRMHNAASAWADGTTGTGVTIAVVDTGVDADSPEFAGRFSSRSVDIYGRNRSISGSDDHGTNVAMVAAAARDGEGILGIAWGANVLAIRADEPGSCAADSSASDAECSFPDSAIAKSIRYATANGAKVINLSLGGPGGTSRDLKDAVRAAVNAGLLVVVSAGNEGLAQLDGFGSQLITAGNGGVIVVGSIDENYKISDFSNRAGSNAASYIVARGDGVCCVYENGELFVDDEGYVYILSGTSFAAPQVAGAAALLAQAFPNLTGREIAQILLDSANDLGARGADAVYGKGSLDIQRALQPAGTTAIAGTAVPLALFDGTGTGSAAMGDAFGSASLPTLMTDRYKRAYRTDLAGTLRGADVPERLHAALDNRQRRVGGGSEQMSVAFSIAQNGPYGDVQAGSLRLTTQEAEQSRVMAARIAMRLSPATQLGVAYAEGAGGLVAQMRGTEQPVFMVARDAAGDDGLFRDTDAAVAVRQQLGSFGLTASAERGKTASGALVQRASTLTGQRLQQDVSSLSLSLDRTFGALDAALGASWMAEDKTLLGARLHDGFGLAGADTLFLDAEAGLDLAAHWRLGGSLRQGFTRARGGGLVADGSRLSSRAWALDIARSDLLARGDSLAFRVSQPLRVEGGGLNLSLPDSWDYATLTPTYAVQHLSLSPQGREINGELAWRGPVLGGFGAASVFYRRDPGHYASLPDDKGVALRWNVDF